MSEFAAAIVAAYTIMEKALPSVFIGLFLANVTAMGNLAAKADRLLPLFARLTGLPPAAAPVVLLSLADRMAGMAALEAIRQQTGLSDRQVIALNLTAKAPAVAQFFVFSFIPLLVSLFPRAAAVGFLAGYFAAFAVISALGVMLLQIWSDGRLTAGREAVAGIKPVAWRNSVSGALAQTLRPFVRIALWMFASSAAVMLLIRSGAVDMLAAALPVTHSSVEPAAIPLLAAGLVSMVGGVAAVGVAWQEGVIPAAGIVPLLFLMSILHNVYDLFASSLPRTMAVYGRTLGLKVGLTGFVVTQAVMLIFLWLARQGLLG